MARWIIILGYVFFAVSMAFGAGSIISMFGTPVTYEPAGICYYGNYLYHMSNREGAIFQTTTTGSVVRSIPGQSHGFGVHFTGTHFWTTIYMPGMVYYRDSNGSILNSFAGPAEGYGITFDGTHLWYSSARAGNHVWRLTTTGSIVSSFVGPGMFNGGISWDARGYIWLADWRPGYAGGIYRVTTSGSVVESYVPPPMGSRPCGCAWDGMYVWYCVFDSPRRVYQMDTLLTSVLPASVGKIKSIYR